MRAALLIVLALTQFPSARDVFELGRTHDEALFESFNRGYELAPGEAIDRAEVVTEFRRAVLFVHEQALLGQFAITDRDLAKAMAPYEGMIGFVVQARLHPLHVYTKAPSYELYVETGRATKAIGPRPLKRDPVYPPGLGPGSAMSAVRLEGTFPRADIEAATAPMLVVTDDQANVIWKSRIDLARYR
jgi:hypothetical protein